MAAKRIFALIILTGAGLLPAGASRAQSAGDPPVVFGQPMSPRYLVNRLAGPPPQDAAGAASGPGAAEREEDDGPGPFPRRYLFNKLFDSGAGPDAAAKTP